VKTLTEAQLRQVIRQELRNYLFEQEQEDKQQEKSKFFRLALPAIAVAMSLAQSHTSQTLAGDGGQGGSEKPKTYEQQMLEKGINPDQAKNLFYKAGFDETSSKKMAGIFSQQKQYEDQIKQLKDGLKNLPEDNPRRIQAEEAIKNIYTYSKELDKVILNDEKISKGLLEAGPMALEYLLNKGALTGNEKEDYKRMMKYGIENAPLIAAQQAEKDLQIYANTLGILAPMSAEEKIIGWLHNTHPETTQQLTADPNNSWTNIELLQVLTTVDPNYKPKTFQYFDPKGVAITTANELLGQDANNTIDASDAIDAIEKVSKSAKREEYSEERLRAMTPEEIQNIKDPNVRAAVAAAKAKLQESKINKLRQRLNELRGVYV